MIASPLFSLYLYFSYLLFVKPSPSLSINLLIAHFVLYPPIFQSHILLTYNLFSPVPGQDPGFQVMTFPHTVQSGIRVQTCR
ncbi:hypothetical protein BC829DRAFT_388062 [Chytridium lagenaria]|nr:hypothetical protein BC829DRAFT_388062 [Chytridium lagenaria]